MNLYAQVTNCDFIKHRKTLKITFISSALIVKQSLVQKNQQNHFSPNWATLSLIKQYCQSCLELHFSSDMFK